MWGDVGGRQIIDGCVFGECDGVEISVESSNRGDEGRETRVGGVRDEEDIEYAIKHDKMIIFDVNVLK